MGLSIPKRVWYVLEKVSIHFQSAEDAQGRIHFICYLIRDLSRIRRFLVRNFQGSGVCVYGIWVQILTGRVVNMNGITHVYVWRDSSVFVKWRIDVCSNSFMCVAGGNHECDVTHRYDSWSEGTCDVTQSCVYYDSIMRETWIYHVCTKTQSRVWHDSFMYVPWLNRVTWLNHSSVAEKARVVLCLLYICVYVCTYSSALSCVWAG